MARVEIDDDIYEGEAVEFDITVPGDQDLTGGVPAVSALRRSSPSATPVQATATLVSAGDRLISAVFAEADLEPGVWFLQGRIALPSGAAPLVVHAEFTVQGTFV